MLLVILGSDYVFNNENNCGLIEDGVFGGE